MTKTRIGITLLLTMIALVLIGWNFSGFNQQVIQPVDHNLPTYQSQQTVTAVYALDGKLHYRLMAEEVKNYTNSSVNNKDLDHSTVTWFTKPVMTLFDENAVGSWAIKADQAKLTDSKMLYLYGHVEVNNLTAISQLQKITTDNAEVNLINQNISSNDDVNLYGVGFTVNGMKMRGNLRNQTVELSEKVKTHYENQQ
ncbi:LPS export ABC transporter periplasmic protein LptC [Candidatus Regiella insecticola]|uniref:Lipopolysaccharide export system protein LptC n=1 Tax=Candidatus Regiella insecticola TaxID=138073 RepID=A0A6L2ZQ88_9ENTR|nr:LPS export ABC transporter periplasmic protein LptC [Candidatus Regiella insecticola]GFN46712.1 lipopolysaccharide export system protein LptC [Candidatus Regiella insecticola]